MATFDVYCETGVSVAVGLTECEAIQWAEGYADGNQEPAFVVDSTDPTECIYEILPLQVES